MRAWVGGTVFIFFLNTLVIEASAPSQVAPGYCVNEWREVICEHDKIIKYVSFHEGMQICVSFLLIYIVIYS